MTNAFKRNFWILEAVIIAFILIGMAFGKWSYCFGEYGWIASTLLVIMAIFGGMVIGIATHNVEIRQLQSRNYKQLEEDSKQIHLSLAETRKLYKTICIGIIELAINRIANKITAKYVKNMSQTAVREAVLKAVDEIVDEEMADANKVFEEHLKEVAKKMS